MKIEGIGMPHLMRSDPSAMANKLEQAFLEEMLKYCGPGAMSGGFGGGAGEDQFAGFLTQSYAGMLAEKLDLGLLPRAEGKA